MKRIFALGLSSSTLIKAIRKNNFVVPLLLSKEVPERPRYVSPQSLNEAKSIVEMTTVMIQCIPGALEWLEEAMFRSGMKPDDDGSILFALLQKGRILVELSNGKKIEVTSDVNDMPGRGLDQFCLAPGMKEHHPGKIVAYQFDKSSVSDNFLLNFVTFRFDKVKSIPFWNILHNAKEVNESDEKHHCRKCYEDASFRCSGCKITWYCSRACQKDDWKATSSYAPGHKVMCKKFIKH